MKPAKADAIMHPVRVRIILRLAAGAAGRRMTAQELRDELRDVSLASLYRHLARLVDVGVVEVVDEHPVRGTVQRVYALGQAATHLSAEDVVNLTREDHLRYFLTFVAGLLGDFARYLERPKIDMAVDYAGYQQLPLYLSDDEMKRLVRDLNAVVSPLLRNEPSPERSLRLFTSVIIPADEPSESNRRSGKD